MRNKQVNVTVMRLDKVPILKGNRLTKPSAPLLELDYGPQSYGVEMERVT